MPALIFIFGLLVGSFLNAVIHRLSSGQSILEKSSRCPRCGHELHWIDLIPLLSFFLLRGRCRYCGKPISWQYPVVELTTAIVFVIIYYKFLVSTPPFFPPQAWGGVRGEVELLFFQLIFASFLIVIFVYDLKHYLILDKVLLPAVISALGYDIWFKNFQAGLWGAGLLAGFFALLYLVSRGRWIGAGDIKLAVFLGFLVPYPATLALFFLAYLAGAIVSVGLLAAGGKKLTDRIPFGTFLTFAAFVAMLWGEELVGWYFGLIGLK